MALRFVRSILLSCALATLVRSWPSLYKDCKVFPEFGEPQPREKSHPPMTWLCEPVAPTSFEWCMDNCAAQAHFPNARQNCSQSLCVCDEHCMDSEEVCQVHPAESLPDAINARKGDTGLLLDNDVPTLYSAGSRHLVTVVPSASAQDSSWFLVDAGAGVFSTIASAPDPDEFRVECDGTRVSFKSPQNQPVEIVWTAPSDTTAPPVALRVAAATSMGNLSVNAAVLNAGDHESPLPGDLGYFCHVVERQCVSLPVGTSGAWKKEACDAMCEPEGRYQCEVCGHKYDSEADGGGASFEDLPDDWKCPLCGAPKSKYKEMGERDKTPSFIHV